MRFVTTQSRRGLRRCRSPSRCSKASLPTAGCTSPSRFRGGPPTRSRSSAVATLTEIGARVLQPFVRRARRRRRFEAIVEDALNFPIPLVEIEPGIYALELFHGPTLAFKDVGARVMARLMAALVHAATSRSRCWSPPPATPAAPSPTPFTACRTRAS